METFCNVWKCYAQLEVGSLRWLAALLICKTTACADASSAGRSHIPKCTQTGGVIDIS